MATFAEDTLPPDVVHALLGRSGPRVSDWGAATRRGSARQTNEDACAARDLRAFAVADGMGGRRGGAVAANAAVDALLDRLGGERTLIDWQATITECNDAVRRAASDAGYDHTGAAAVALRVADGRATLVHLGDVRAYRLGEEVTQLTSDHNVAGELTRAHLDPQRLRFHPAELAALTVFFGDPDSAGGFGIRTVNVAAGDRIVLCTDGVHGALGPDGWQTVAALSSPTRAAEALVDLAVAAGSSDDATALVVAFGGRR